MTLPLSSAQSPDGAVGATAPGPAGQSDQRSNERQQSIRLVFQGQQRETGRRGLLRLARLLRIDVWGTSLLNRRAAGELSAAAALLLVVLVFELASWTLLFNMVVNFGRWQISWMSLVALLLGSTFATGVFIFERTFITADFTEASLRKWLGIGIRVALICGSLVATAQPVELLVFHGAIENRLHEETVQAEAVRQVEALDKLEKEPLLQSRAAIEGSLNKTLAARHLSETQAAESNARQGLIGLQVQLSEARASATTAVSRVQDARSAVTEAKRRLRDASPETQSDAEDAVKAAEANLEAWQRRSAAAKGRIAGLEHDVEVSRAQNDDIASGAAKAKTDFEGLVKTGLEADRTRASGIADSIKATQEWMRTVESAPPGQNLVEPKTNRPLTSQPADFTDRLRILDDLRTGRSPLWPRTSTETRKKAAQLFSLEDPDAPDSTMNQRRKDDSTLFNRIWLIAFVLAGVIPFLTIAFKSMTASELREYFSTVAQARAGNPAAIEALRARGVSLSSLFPASPRQASGSAAADSVEGTF